MPELASRAHEQNIVPVVSEAIRRAGITAQDLDAIAFTRGPGLLGSLLVGTNFAKGLSLSLGIPMVEVNHLHAHVLAHFIEEEGEEHQSPEFPLPLPPRLRGQLADHPRALGLRYGDHRADHR